MIPSVSALSRLYPPRDELRSNELGLIGCGDIPALARPVVLNVAPVSGQQSRGVRPRGEGFEAVEAPRRKAQANNALPDQIAAIQCP